MIENSAVLVAIGPADVPYAHRLRAVFNSAGATRAPAHKDSEGTSPELLAAKARNLGVGGVVVLSDAVFEAICRYMNIPPQVGKKQAYSRANYAGSLFTIAGVDFVILPTAKALVAVGHAVHVMSTYVQKLTKPHAWMPQPEFVWTSITDQNANTLLAEYHSANFLSVDIETRNSPSHGVIITMIGFTAVWMGGEDGTSMRMHTAVLPWNSESCTYWTDKFCNLPVRKVLQNGKYDIVNLMRYGITLENYSLDTIQMQHAWYAELPKDLAMIAGMHVRNVQYWKDLADSAAEHDKLLYNALDCYQTACAAISMLIHMPAWARTNYNLKFKMIYPAIMCEMRGMLVDSERFVSAKAELQEKLAADVSMLQRMTGVRDFNANSPAQVAKLLTVLGIDAEGTDSATLEAIAYKDPFASLFTEQILKIRKTAKLLGTYFDASKLYKGRFLYALIPYGTDTGRNASGESSLWCGQNIQNIPRGKIVKQYLVADEDFMLAEVDSEQAESRDTAYISGDERLIDAVENSPDFHSQNCSAFFGVPFKELYDVETGKVLNKDLRDIAKRVNHGANYCMGPAVLVTTMGLKNIDKAKRLLNLPRTMTPKQVAEWLLARFHATYPGIDKLYYRWLRKQVATVGLLTGAMGWTRKTFGDVLDKRTFNSYAAHCPQSANAIRLDAAFFRVFVDLALHPVHSKNFKFVAQIHDSIFFQFRKGHEYLIDEVRTRMEIPVTVTGCDGKTRTYVVPAAAKAGKDGRGAYRWSETE